MEVVFQISVFLVSVVAVLFGVLVKLPCPEIAIETAVMSQSSVSESIRKADNYHSDFI